MNSSETGSAVADYDGAIMREPRLVLAQGMCCLCSGQRGGGGARLAGIASWVPCTIREKVKPQKPAVDAASVMARRRVQVWKEQEPSLAGHGRGSRDRAGCRQPVDDCQLTTVGPLHFRSDPQAPALSVTLQV